MHIADALLMSGIPGKPRSFGVVHVGWKLPWAFAIVATESSRAMKVHGGYLTDSGRDRSKVNPYGEEAMLWYLLCSLQTLPNTVQHLKCRHKRKYKIQVLCKSMTKPGDYVGVEG